MWSHRPELDIHVNAFFQMQHSVLWPRMPWSRWMAMRWLASYGQASRRSSYFLMLRYDTLALREKQTATPPPPLFMFLSLLLLLEGRCNSSWNMYRGFHGVGIGTLTVSPVYCQCFVLCLPDWKSVLRFGSSPSWCYGWSGHDRCSVRCPEAQCWHQVCHHYTRWGSGGR